MRQRDGEKDRIKGERGRKGEMEREINKLREGKSVEEMERKERYGKSV